MNIRQAAFFLVALASAAPQLAAGQAIAPLEEKLEVRVTQSGIAGESGMAWIIDPSGTWIVHRVERGKLTNPVASGTLDPTEVSRLKSVLSDNEVAKLPASVGTFTRANPKRLTIQWGGRASTLVAPGGGDFTASDSTGTNTVASADRMLSIANEVRKLTTN